jgi:hypothetical protein
MNEPPTEPADRHDELFVAILLMPHFASQFVAAVRD